MLVTQNSETFWEEPAACIIRVVERRKGGWRILSTVIMDAVGSPQKRPYVSPKQRGVMSPIKCRVLICGFLKNQT